MNYFDKQRLNGYLYCQVADMTDGLFIGLLCKMVSTSATFVFIIDALPDGFLPAIDPVTQDRYTKSVIGDASGNVSPGYFC
ncbi:hypothetical protein TNCV_4111 [Trichonephila clavipes]|nr:hypothetical protein TNCV_4111 [Trichonephila clavipes]